ncbi:MAG: MFS transporter [Rhodobacteraceae bacterium]|nr:MFS transporter [Paracoccaceae bacterium]
MLEILSNRTYRHLFAAQLVALTGTGLATVALGLLAFSIAGESAGLVLGTALTIKMIAYVTVAPVAAAIAEHLDRRRMLVVLDLVRAAAAVCLPFVTEIWQIYVLIFLLQSASAGFTPAFQATIPDVLTKEKDYTRALSLSRLAMDMESLVSPILAAALLTLVSFNSLFLGTSLGFVASALLVVSVVLPSPKPAKPRGIYDRTTKGLRIYLKTPRLRGLLALNWVISAVGSMVIVNTVVIVRGDLGLSENAVAMILAAFGGGSMLAALGLPRVIEAISDRTVVLFGAGLSILALFVTALFPITATTICVGWFFTGLGYSAVLTPSGRLLARSAHPEDRPAVFAAQFALSHGCWLVFYPTAGAMMTWYGASTSMIFLSIAGLAGLITAGRLWPADSRLPVAHDHSDLPADHPHLQGGIPHSHPIIIDDLHPHYPR